MYYGDLRQGVDNLRLALELVVNRVFATAGFIPAGR